MVFQKPNPFPKSIYENVAYGPRIHGLAAVEGASSTRSSSTSLQAAGLCEEVKDRLTDSGTGLSGGQQQRLCIARADRGQPGSHPDGRAVLGARPDRDRQDRGTDRRTAGEFHDHHRHPLHAAGGARVAAHRLLPSRRFWSRRARPSKMFTDAEATSARRTTSPAGSADGGGPKSMTMMRTYRQGVRRRSAGAHPQGRRRWAAWPSARSPTRSRR